MCADAREQPLSLMLQLCHGSIGEVEPGVAEDRVVAFQPPSLGADTPLVGHDGEDAAHHDDEGVEAGGALLLERRRIRVDELKVDVLHTSLAELG